MQCSKVPKKNLSLISVFPNNVVCYVQKYSVQCRVSFKLTLVVYVNVLNDITWLKVNYDHGHEQEQIKGLKLSKPKSE